MSLLGLKTFRHGVHPPEAKDETSGSPIRQFPFAPVLVVPLVQHMGKPAVPVVREGQEVARGQTIAAPDGFMSVAMHAPASGTVRRIGLTPSIAGKMVPGVYIEPFPGSTQEVVDGLPCPLDTATRDEIVTAIQAAGVVGLGGAAFPTHVKLKLPAGKSIDTLIINGVECEPYLTTDHRVMLEQRDDVFMGIRYLLKVTGAARAIVGVEANKPDAAAHLRAGLPADVPVSVEVLRVKYPQGAEKMLITALLGREVPSGGLPVDVGALCANVATTAEIGRLLPHGRGIQERVITITGPAVKPSGRGNYRIPIGTPLRFLLETVGLEDDVNRVFLGGPMMGAAASSLDIPITKGTSGVTAFTDRLAEGTHRTVHPCIRCAYCVDACPIFLNPADLGLLAKNGEYQRMADEHHLMDCFECGSCSFVCPSHIPLVQQFRMAKAAVRKAAAPGAVGGGLMARKTLEIRTSPHVLSGYSVDTIMFNVVLALLPTTAFAVVAFGLAALLTLAVAIAACLATEHLTCRLAGRRSTVGDWSVTITGLLYGLTLPPGLPLWMTAVGAVVAVALGKAIFGGLGANPFNPALVGRAFLQAAFPAALTTWHPAFLADRFVTLPSSTLAPPLSAPAYDGITSATPLALWKFEGVSTPTADLLFGLTSGSTGETAAFLILLGGIYLAARNMMSWHIPVSVLATVALTSGALHLVDPARYASPAFMLFSGGLMLGAVFMATDMVASPMTSAGCWVYGALIGLLVVVIRVWGGMPEGVMYAILLANAVSPHIDRLIRPRVYGTHPAGGTRRTRGAQP